MVSQLIPNPSEGKVRALFGTGNISSNTEDSTMASKARAFRSQQSGRSRFKSENIDFESSSQYPTNVESTMRYQDQNMNKNQVEEHER